MGIEITISKLEEYSNCLLLKREELKSEKLSISDEKSTITAKDNSHESFNSKNGIINLLKMDTMRASNNINKMINVIGGADQDIANELMEEG